MALGEPNSKKMALYLLKFFPSILLLLVYNYSRTTHALLQNQRPCCSVNTSGTTFKNNLHSLLMSITTSAQSNGGYFNDTVDTSTDQIYGLGMCYASANLTTCNNCLSTVASKITSDCPDSKNAGTWLESGPCVIRYSNENFFGVANTTSYYIYSSENYTDDHVLFGNARNALFNTLIAKINVSVNMVGTGQESVNGIDKLYGLLQCTRDLNHQECYKCLSSLISDLQPPSLLAYTVGLRYFGFSCYVNYEMFPISITLQGVTSGTSPAPENAGPVTEPGTGSKKSKTIVIVAVVGSVATLLIIISICIWFQRKWSLSGGIKLFFKELQDVAASEFLIYNFTTIRNATNNFSDKNKLGMGGFGPVFKGRLPNGQEIAVKRLSTSSTQGATEFKTEVELLVRLRHNNLVQLLGCCISKDERMLCYEYLPNRSLDKILFGSDDIKCKELEWSRRYRIIKGTCRGLHYLHEESPLKIVHRDFKASNILLDRDMNPKIADFGLARLFDRDQTQTVTAHLAGTFGYIAPECSMRGSFSAKSDTYSFGILVLEIVTGRKNSSFPGSIHMSGLINHVWKNWNEGKMLELKDPTLNKECIEEITKCIHIALLCLQMNPSNRPNMETVANMLNSSSIASLTPLPPPRFIWGADVSMFEDDENSITNLSGWETVSTVVGDKTEENSLISL
ncbi:cysteine-rich receptor-like protein kinase 15 [Carex rostrata]